MFNPDFIANHPLNAPLRVLRERNHDPARIAAVAFPDDVPNAYLALGTHPDLVARLWDELGKAVPVDCRAIFFGGPALIHPVTGVVFGFAGGTHAYALRLPPTEHAEALEAGAKRVMIYPGNQPPLDLDAIGPEWVLCNWFKEEGRWCRAAYDFAGASIFES